MKHIAFLIFFTVFFGIFFLGSWYVYSRGALAVGSTTYTLVFKWVFWGLTLAFAIGQFLERGTPTLIGHVITNIGSIWLVILWYLFLSVLIIDIVRLGNYFFHFIPPTWVHSFLKGPNLFIGVVSATLLLVFAGYLNAYNPRIVHVNIPINKPQAVQQNIKVALVTDIHMGHIVGNHKVKRLVNKLNNENPDLIIFGGDLVDHNPLPVIKYKMGEHFLKLNPSLGKYAITGNHEYIGKPDISIAYLSQFGINYIRDSVVNIGDILWLAGRDDRDKSRFTGHQRITTDKLLNGIDKTKPILLMDHQPVEFNAAVAAGVDLMVSGHTHKGQFWPFGLITKRVFELDWGLLKKGGTHFYVSSGYGTWGPPVRIASRPEIVILNLQID